MGTAGRRSLDAELDRTSLDFLIACRVASQVVFDWMGRQGDRDGNVEERPGSTEHNGG